LWIFPVRQKKQGKFAGGENAGSASGERQITLEEARILILILLLLLILFLLVIMLLLVLLLGG